MLAGGNLEAFRAGLKIASEDIPMNINELSVGLIGGTGEEGRGLALRWAIAGARVSIGSRTLDRAKAVADDLNQLLGSRAGQPIGYGENRDVIPRSELALLT